MVIMCVIQFVEKLEFTAYVPNATLQTIDVIRKTTMSPQWRRLKPEKFRVQLNLRTVFVPDFWYSFLLRTQITSTSRREKAVEY